VDAASALNSGYHLAYVIGAVLVAAALAISLIVFREPRPERAPRVRAAQPEAA
jgi:hypothetical protein